MEQKQKKNFQRQTQNTFKGQARKHLQAQKIQYHDQFLHPPLQKIYHFGLVAGLYRHINRPMLLKLKTWVKEHHLNNGLEWSPEWKAWRGK